MSTTDTSSDEATENAKNDRPSKKRKCKADAFKKMKDLSRKKIKEDQEDGHISDSGSDCDQTYKVPTFTRTLSQTSTAKTNAGADKIALTQLGYPYDSPSCSKTPGKGGKKDTKKSKEPTKAKSLPYTNKVEMQQAKKRLLALGLSKKVSYYS